ncbi:MAG: glycosyltransferase [Quadrisphaera sp.]
MDLQYVVPNMTHQGGIQSYARTVAEYLPTENFSLKWIDFSDPARDLKVLARLSKARLTPVALKGRTASGITHHWFPTSAILDFARSTVVTCHGSELLHDGAYGLRNRAIKAALAALPAAVTVPSNFTKELLVDRFATDPASIHVIPPGVDIGRARPRLNLTKDELPVKVGCLSRLVERKNIAESVRAAGLLAKSQPRPVEFHLAGDGPELSAIWKPESAQG